MPKYLTDTQVDQYNTQGYCAPIDVMPEDEALSLGEQLNEAEKKHPGIIGGRNRNNAHLIFSFMDEIAFNQTILDIVEDLIGPDILMWGSVLFIKEPQSQGYVSWHQDATYMGLEPKNFVTPWLALSPSNEFNGCMQMIPGSHLDNIKDHQDTFEQHNILTRGQAIVDVDESKAVSMELKPGQASCHHARTIHGSSPNKSNQKRIGVALQAYLQPKIRQTKGDSYAILARGEDNFHHHNLIQRPFTDLAPDDMKTRDLVNETWSKVLYSGAEKQRNY